MVEYQKAIKAAACGRHRVGSSNVASESSNNYVKLAGRFFQALQGLQNDSVRNKNA